MKRLNELKNDIEDLYNSNICNKSFEIQKKLISKSDTIKYINEELKNMTPNEAIIYLCKKLLENSEQIRQSNKNNTDLFIKKCFENNYLFQKLYDSLINNASINDDRTINVFELYAKYKNQCSDIDMLLKKIILDISEYCKNNEINSYILQMATVLNLAFDEWVDEYY